MKICLRRAYYNSLVRSDVPRLPKPRSNEKVLAWNLSLSGIEVQDRIRQFVGTYQRIGQYAHKLANSTIFHETSDNCLGF